MEEGARQDKDLELECRLDSALAQVPHMEATVAMVAAKATTKRPKSSVLPHSQIHTTLEKKPDMKAQVEPMGRRDRRETLEVLGEE